LRLDGLGLCRYGFNAGDDTTGANQHGTSLISAKTPGLDIVHSDDDTFVIDAGSFDLQVGFTRLTCLILMSNLRAIIGLLACVIFSNASAANFSATGTPRYYLVQSWQTDKGLPQNWVSSIAQTPDGYLS